MPKNNSINMGAIEIPENYFELSQEDKEAICTVLLDNLLRIIDKEFNPMFNRFDLLDKIIESSIITNLKDEKYEICAVLKDIRNLIHESESK